MAKVAVVAIGGNSLIKDKEHQTVKDQYEAIKETCHHITKLIDVGLGYETIITHGNGPQVGFILLRSELAKQRLHTIPIDSADADTQGAIGYNIQMALGNEFKRRGIKKDVVTVVTQIVVDKNDPAFQNPTKPIGPFYDREEAERGRDKYGWSIIEDAGRGYRRVVPSPKPKRIVELDAIETLIKNGFVVVAAGGGGIPVIEENGELKGIEAVIDKDYASSLLASRIKAELFLIFTSVEKVYLNFNTNAQKPIDLMSAKEAETYLSQGHFAEGSMAPKIKAAVSFLKNGGKEVIITTPERIEEAIRGTTGTRIVP